MSRRKRIQLSPDEQLLADVRTACSADKTRPFLATPFGIEWRGSHFLVGTDGHRAAFVRADAELVKRHAREDAPPFGGILDMVAEFPAAGVVDTTKALSQHARVFPSRWTVEIKLPQPPQQWPHLRVACSGAKLGTIYPFGVELIEVQWSGFAFGDLHEDIGLNLRYLIEAVDFVGTCDVSVHAKGALDPVVILPSGFDLATAPRGAVVMPTRL